jgi:hypothetical protein
LAVAGACVFAADGAAAEADGAAPEVLAGALAAGPEVPAAACELELDGAAAELVPAGLEAAADFDSSSRAFCCEVETAPLAFATALVRPATPGAEPW